MPYEVYRGNALDAYDRWLSPNLIISDGAYGLGIFDGEPKNTSGLADWYAPHVDAWTRLALPSTTLWLWNCERGWPHVHRLLEDAGWLYRETTVWNKGVQHIAGKVNSNTIRTLPVVTEIAVRYTRKLAFVKNGDVVVLQDYMRAEWRRSGLPMSEANIACGCKNAASRKYLAADHLWYMPSGDMMRAMISYCNEHGRASGRPYFSEVSDFDDSMFNRMRETWNHIHGLTNVWSDIPPLRSSERIRANGKILHANQKPLDLIKRQICLATNIGDVVWEPFGGTGTATVAAHNLGRHGFCAETNPVFCDVIESRLRRL